MRYDYRCPQCGIFESQVAADMAQCRCGAQGRRLRGFALNRSSLRSEARWDPVVGQYVRSNREFDYLLRQGQEAESEKLNMEVKLQSVDARDSDALASLHGHSTERREHDLDSERKVKFDQANA
jgi:hypothetical protein